MGSRKVRLSLPAWIALGLVALIHPLARAQDEPDAAAQKWVQIQAKDKQERTALAEAGVSIEAVRSDSVWGFANDAALERVKQAGHQVLGVFDSATGRGGHDVLFGLDFPPQDSRFHNYQETLDMLKQLNAANPDITKLVSIGKSVEGRDLWAININTSPDQLRTGHSTKPGAIYMGAHHAREHVSTEIPLMLIDHLLKNRKDPQVGALLENRDIWVIPIVNPDGKEYDVATGKYRMWRKNRRDNRDGTFGVDLNRNYGHGWGTGGSSKDTSSDVYMGPAPFSEPETQAIRDFVTDKSNTKVLLTFHTFSELILYPWGGTYDDVANAKDRATFEKMGKTMAGWNHYTPEKSSDLYIASGDTVDWAYGERGIFAFTFELSPSSMMDGGFYPGQGIIDKVFNDNLRPCMYLLDVADDPYKVLGGRHTKWLRNYAEPSLSYDQLNAFHPLPEARAGF